MDKLVALQWESLCRMIGKRWHAATRVILMEPGGQHSRGRAIRAARWHSCIVGNQRLELVRSQYIPAVGWRRSCLSGPEIASRPLLFPYWYLLFVKLVCSSLSGAGAYLLLFFNTSPRCLPEPSKPRSVNHFHYASHHRLRVAAGGFLPRLGH